MDQWLIRTAENQIAGPYSREQVCKLILDGQLGLEDEVCQANGYWIFLHEREEIAQHLGVQVPRSAGSDEEVTETQTETVTEVLADETALPEVDSSLLNSEGANAPDQTMVLNRGFRSIRTQPVVRPAKAAVPEVAGVSHPLSGISTRSAPFGLEASALLRGLAWVFVASAIFVIVAVVHLLRTR